MKQLLPLIILCLFITTPGKAAEPCAGQDKSCLFGLLEQTADGVTEESWRDSTYRELAKLLTLEGQHDRAIALIPRIKTPDTKAMTIRGIGMAAATRKLTPEEYALLFTRLHEEAQKIDHPPSHAIALTYIAMSQAFAGDNDGAMKTAAAMENPALRNKAYAESAEIQAERGDLPAVMISLGAIDDPAFRDKGYRTVSKIFADRKLYEEALKTAEPIQNTYQRAQAILYSLTKQIAPEEVSVE